MPTPPHPLPFPWVDNEAAHKRRMRRHAIEMWLSVIGVSIAIAAVAYRAWQHWSHLVY